MSTSLTTSANSAHPVILPPDEYERELESLVQEWNSHHENDLEVRYKTGILLNQHLGNPATRNQRGAEVVKNAAERLGTTKSDISRVRWFAYLFSSIQDLGDKYPKAKSWTAVKGILPEARREAMPEAMPKGKTQGAGTKSRAANRIKVLKLKKVECLLNQLQKLITGVNEHLDKVEQADLQRKISDTAEKIRICLSTEKQNLLSACTSDVSGCGASSAN